MYTGAQDYVIDALALHDHLPQLNIILSDPQILKVQPLFNSPRRGGTLDRVEVRVSVTCTRSTMQPMVMQGMLRLPSCWACKPLYGNICRDMQAKFASFLKVPGSPDSHNCTSLGLCVYS